MRKTLFLFLFCTCFAFADIVTTEGASYIFKGDGGEIYFDVYKDGAKVSGHMFSGAKTYEFDGENVKFDGEKLKIDENSDLTLKLNGKELKVSLNSPDEHRNLNMKMYKRYSILSFNAENQPDFDKKGNYSLDISKNVTPDNALEYFKTKKDMEKEYRALKLERENSVNKDEIDSVYSVSSDERVFYENNKLLVLLESSYIYTGGAHGMGVESYYVLIGKKQISIDDLLKNSSDEKLKSMIWDKIKDVAFEEVKNEFKISDNFYISPNGVTFVYAPYEVAAYAYGSVKAHFTFDEISPFLKDGIKKALKI